MTEFLFDEMRPPTVPIMDVGKLPIKRPLLAAKAGLLEDFAKLQFPVLVSPKLDGIRCITKGDVVVTRSFKPVPNVYTRTILQGIARMNPEILCDGELMLQAGAFSDVQSAFMSFDGEPDFIFNIFDVVKDSSTQEPFYRRYERLSELVKPGAKFLRVVPHYQVDCLEELQQYAHEFIEQNYEGIMIRAMKGRYKEGRSTLREQVLIKWKPLLDDEAVVVRFEPLMTNTNAAEKNVFGLTERSSEKAGMVAKDTCGSIIAKHHQTGQEFGIGTGLTAAQREYIWNNRRDLIGKLVSYQHEGLGSDQRPRFPRFRGFRSGLDM